MKDQIDTLVRSILQDLQQPSVACPQLAVFMASIGADGPARAAAKLAILISYAEDFQLDINVRQYAQRQVNALPSF